MADSGRIFKTDRYHDVMASFVLKLFEASGLGQDDPDASARFYVTQRKMPYTTFVGHSDLLQALQSYPLDHPRRSFLAQDRARLGGVAELFRRQYPGKIRAVQPGTVVFAGQPILDVDTPFAAGQLGEVALVQVVDLYTTLAYFATGIKLTYSDAEKDTGVALLMKVDLDGKLVPHSRPALSDFSLRRGVDAYQASVAALVARICGWDDTSNMEAGFTHGIMTVGTMAHYLMLYAIGLMKLLVERGKAVASFYHADGSLKHPQLWIFEKWLDAHPNGTSLLLDTFGLELGLRHAVEAAKSSQPRRKALKFGRGDSLYAPAMALYARRFFDENDLPEVRVMATGDMDREIGRRIIAASKFFGGGNIAWLCGGYGIGTKYITEHKVAGAIFKVTEACGYPVCKISSGKGTFPGKLQIYRVYNDLGAITRQLTGLEDQPPELEDGEVAFEVLLQPFYGYPGCSDEVFFDPEALRRLYWEDVSRFQIPIEQFAQDKKRVGMTRGLQELMTSAEQYGTDSHPTDVVFPKDGYVGALKEIKEFERDEGFEI